MKKYLKSKSGVTLLALVITIVVLLILAGISITAAIGENGIIHKTKTSANDQTRTMEKTTLEVVVTNWSLQRILNDTITEEDLLNNIVKSGLVEDRSKITGEDGLYKVTTKNKNVFGIKIDEQGNVDIITVEELMAEQEKRIKVEMKAQIKVNVKSSNETLGSFPVVFTLEGTKDGKTVYQDIVEANIKTVGVENLNITANIPQDTKLTVTQVYSGANYQVISSKTLEQTITKEQNTVDFTFEQEYNYKLNGNSAAIIK